MLIIKDNFYETENDNGLSHKNTHNSMKNKYENLKWWVMELKYCDRIDYKDFVIEQDVVRNEKRRKTVLEQIRLPCFILQRVTMTKVDSWPIIFINKLINGINRLEIIAHI